MFIKNEVNFSDMCCSAYGCPPYVKPFIYNVILVSINQNKRIAVMKTLREITDLTLEEIKNITVDFPSMIKSYDYEDDAKIIVKKINDAGGIAIIER